MVKKYVGGGVTGDEVSEEGKRQLKYQEIDAATKKAYEDHYKRETAENEATSKAVGDALMYIPRKIKKAVGFKKGGTASARADGCCTKGKTKGRII